VYSNIFCATKWTDCSGPNTSAASGEAPAMKQAKESAARLSMRIPLDIVFEQVYLVESSFAIWKSRLFANLFVQRKSVNCASIAHCLAALMMLIARAFCLELRAYEADASRRCDLSLNYTRRESTLKLANNVQRC
jgi:hypothetical protein